MDILDKIVQRKKEIVAGRKKMHPIPTMALSFHFARKTISLVERLKAEDSSGIIAEFKRSSPSKGIINSTSMVKDVVKGYRDAGVAGLSILTDTPFFGGTNDDILNVRPIIDLPILRKDFIVDEYQVYETKAMGADVILLIAECLTKAEVSHLAKLAKHLGLEIIMEIHSEDQLDKYVPEIDIIGVNNRNLKTFEVSIEQSKALFDALPKDVVKISESGISDAASILELKACGFEGFLIGENFMKTEEPGQACDDFIKSLKA